jgi:hypothetical protein
MTQIKATLIDHMGSRTSLQSMQHELASARSLSRMHGSGMTTQMVQHQVTSLLC